MSSVDALIEKLAATSVEEEKEVSFAGRGLKLDSENDANEIVSAIKNCPGMTALKLEGNTIGIDAAKAIAKALESQPKFRKALWKDMFTRRTEHEIPDALNYLSSGIMLAKANLEILDLSDNAFGPRGLKGIVNLLKSEPCYTLKELYLNNNGLGISGGKMLANALSQCLENSSKEGRSFSLKVFVCGRNRLENEGALALSKFLKDIGTLELIAMPQNGIYHEGIKGLSEALAVNTGLKCLNLEDNSLTEEGAAAIAKHLPSLRNLEVLNFGDCLIRTEGALVLADALKNSCPNLREVHLGYNEISKEGGKAIVEALENKFNLEKLVLNGNQFGIEGCDHIEEMMIAMGKEGVLGSLSEDEGDEGDDDDDDDDESNEDEENDKESESDDGSESKEHISVLHKYSTQQKVTLKDFLAEPSSEKLLSLEVSDSILTDFKNETRMQYMDMFLKIASVVTPGDEEAKIIACQCADIILPKVFTYSDNTELKIINNDFLVSLGLLKGEDKKKVVIDLTGALIVLEHAIQQHYFSNSTKDLLQFFLSRHLASIMACAKTKHTFMQTLFRVL